MISFEWWSFEISTIVVGSINETELAINTVILQFGTLLYMVINVLHMARYGSMSPIFFPRFLWVWEQLLMSESVMNWGQVIMSLPKECPTLPLESKVCGEYMRERGKGNVHVYNGPGEYMRGGGGCA